MMLSNEILGQLGNENHSYHWPNAIDTSIFSWKELENLINLKPFISSDRFIPITKVEERYDWSIKAWQTQQNSWPKNLLQKFIDNNVCYIRDCSTVNESINNICFDIESKTSMPTDAHIYFATNKIQSSFDKHFDESHNLIVQIDGITNIKVYTKTGNKIDLNVTMKPGDAMYIPRKYDHVAISKTKRLSISFPMSLTGDVQEREWIKW